MLPDKETRLILRSILLPVEQLGEILYCLIVCFIKLATQITKLLSRSRDKRAEDMPDYKLPTKVLSSKKTGK